MRATFEAATARGAADRGGPRTISRALRQGAAMAAVAVRTGCRSGGPGLPLGFRDRFDNGRKVAVQVLEFLRPCRAGQVRAGEGAAVPALSDWIGRGGVRPHGPAPLDAAARRWFTWLEGFSCGSYPKAEKNLFRIRQQKRHSSLSGSAVSCFHRFAQKPSRLRAGRMRRDSWSNRLVPAVPCRDQEIRQSWRGMTSGLGKEHGLLVTHHQNLAEDLSFPRVRQPVDM